MKTYTSKKMSTLARENIKNAISRRHRANYERFMQERADVFQVTDTKDQAMFWALR